MKELVFYKTDEAFLRQVSQPVKEFGSALTHIVDDMTWVMRSLAGNGLGISAIQTREPLRLGILELNYDHKNKGKPFVMVNPVILEVGIASETTSEGCLSFPGEFLEITRPAFVKVGFQDIEGKPREMRFLHMWARCVLHEVDHMNGRLFIDFANGGAIGNRP